jgi:ribosomal peptide maturation radical SAM protein 1
VSLATNRAGDAFQVALVSMPFATTAKPSLQLGLLQSIARSRGFDTESFHLALYFARQIGVTAYEALANHRGHLFGDWVFAEAAFGADAPREPFLEDFGPGIELLSPELGTNPARVLRQLRDREAPRYIDDLMELIDWGRFQVVGFTSTFQQNAASFALATRIKQAHPDTCIVFGGANFDGEMGAEFVRSVKCIDYAISGEADAAFPEFLKTVRAGEDPTGIPGIVCRRADQLVAVTPNQPFEALDALPTPDYDDYFARAEALGLLDKISRRSVGIPFESARGCWWGQKHHCTFCGLNAEGMAFRSKSADRLLSELAELSRRYRTFRFEAVDNILPFSYLESFLPLLAKENYQYCLFYETKANLRREQVRLLSEAGVRCIQPGIESFNSNVLGLMRKGVRAAQNVNVLRWASYYNIRVIWNILWGFPGESETDYQSQAALLAHLSHLQPPLSASRIWLERFSPLFADRDRFPMRRIAPEASYFYVYPRHMHHERLAYFFDYELEDSLPDSVYSTIASQVRAWQTAWERPSHPTMTFRHSREFLQIDDQRGCGTALTYTLTGPLASIYAASSDRPQRATVLKQSLAIDWSLERIEQALNHLSEQGLMMRDGEDFLSLALPAGASPASRPD